MNSTISIAEICAGLLRYGSRNNKLVRQGELMQLLIVEQNGWSKTVEVDRAITRIGSAEACDVQLKSAQIAPVHIQVLYSKDTASTCKIVNLAGEITARVGRELCELSTYAVFDIRDGDEVLLGNYWITFKLPFSAGVMQSARTIDAMLSFADAVLRPESVSVGVLTIKNAGEQPACQFQVELNGLPADCYQVDPIPLMYPGAQEEVRVRIFHRGLYPLGGLQKVILKISAPVSYPGEELIIQQSIFVTPVFKQVLEIFDDLSAAKKHQAAAEVVPVVAIQTMHAQSFTSAPIVPPQVISQVKLEPPDRPIPIKAPAVAKPVQDLSRLKVVRGSPEADNFWDEK